MCAKRGAKNLAKIAFNQLAGKYFEEQGWQRAAGLMACGWRNAVAHDGCRNGGRGGCSAAAGRAGLVYRSRNA